jgi:small conductance mechanosensitive channel
LHRKTQATGLILLLDPIAEIMRFSLSQILAVTVYHPFFLPFIHWSLFSFFIARLGLLAICPFFIMIPLMGVSALSPEAAWSQEVLEMEQASPQSPPPQPAPETPIPVGKDKVEDGLITQRLVDMYRHIPSLKNVHLEVNAGVVRLSGHTPTKEAHEKALELARRVEGVVTITDDITQKREIGERLALVQEKLLTRFNALLSFLPLLIIGVLVFLGFWGLAAFITRWNRLFQYLTPHAFLQSLFKQIVKITMMFIGFLLMLEILDATALLGAFVGVAGVMGLAIGFAMRDTVENYIASILLSIRQPFRPYDHIVLEHHEGLVIKLTSRETILMTLDGNHVRIPNATVYKGIIVNFSRNPNRRFIFDVGIDTSIDIEAARHLAIDTLQQTPGVIPDPPVQCAVEKLGDSNVMLRMFAWTTQDQYDFGKVKSEAIRAVKEAFDQAGYDMPEPIYRLKVQEFPPIAQRAPSDAPSLKKKITPRSIMSSRSGADVFKDNHLAKQISSDRESNEESDLLQSDE